MSKKGTLFYLSSCSTCNRIIKELNLASKMTLKDIKTDTITEAQLEKMHALAGSYEALFSKRAMKYRSLELNEKTLTEQEIKEWILKEYTFLKRPVALFDDAIFIGNAKKQVEALGGCLSI